MVHIPFFFLATESLSRKGDLVLDPFCGSGTVLLEAQLARRVAVGADANPLARLISKVKTTPYNLAHLRASATRLDARIQSAPTASPPEVINAGLWFSKRILSELARIRGAIARTRSAAHREFFEVCLSVCSRRLSYADPRVSVPVRLNPKNYPLGHPRRADSIAHLESLTK
ncbi:MAG TPA: DNA methyltransferase, partial [Pirellulales bacterium]